MTNLGREIVSIQPLEPRRLLSFALFGGETNVLLPDGGAALRSDSAVARDGTYIVASAVSTAEGTSLVASRYTATGNQLGDLITLRSLSNGSNPAAPRFSDIAVATDDDGDSVVAYSVFDQIESSQTVEFIRVSRTGAVSSPRFLTEGNARNPQVAMAGNGSFFVGWTTFNVLAADVRIAAFNANGDPLAPRFTAAHTVGSVGAFIENLSLSATPDGSSAAFAYTFFEDSDLFPLFDVYHGRVSTSAVIDDATVLPSDHTDSGRVAMLDDGSYYVGYEQIPVVNFTPMYDLQQPFVQKFDSDGDATGPLIPVAAALGEGTHLSDLTAISDGGFAVAVYLGPGSDDSVYTQRFLPGGIPDSPDPILVATDRVDGDTARIGADQNGTALISYLRRTDTDPVRGEVLYRRITAQPAAIDNSVLYLVGTDDAETFDVRPRGLSIVVTYENLLGREEIRYFDPAMIGAISSSLGNGDDSLFNRTALPSVIDGGNGDDTILGGSARDRITGGASDDRLYGGDGDDLLYGQDNEDFLFGGNGNDSLNGGSGADFLRGEFGNDFLAAVDGTTDQLVGHDGSDTADADSEDILRTIEVIL